MTCDRKFLVVVVVVVVGMMNDLSEKNPPKHEDIRFPIIHTSNVVVAQNGTDECGKPQIDQIGFSPKA